MFLVDIGFSFAEVFRLTVPSEVSSEVNGKYADLAFDETKNDDARRVSPSTTDSEFICSQVQIGTK